MNAELKESFSRIKPVCDVVMVCPSAESVSNFVARVSELKKEVVQELQQYLLFPFITHLKSTEIDKKYELQWRLVDGMRLVLEKVVVNSYEMCMKIETSVLQLVFDNTKPGMLADVPEELKHGVMKCLTALQLNLDKRFREKLLKSQVPLLAQAIFVSVHIAKLEKHRALRLSALHCVMAHTATHPQLTTDKYRIPDPALEAQVVDMLSSILPGVLAALQDVATCPNNPGHAVVVASVEAIHRILCLTMQDRLLPKRPDGSPDDFAKIFTDHAREQEHKEVSCKEKLKDEAKPKRSSKWYAMAGEKLTIITKSLLALRTHEHYRVRRELAVYCSRVLNECTLTMQPSMPIVLDILIALSKDEYPAVSTYCASAVRGHFASAGPDKHHRTMDNLAENLFVMLNGLPRILNNIDTNRKLYALNLLHGYLQVMIDTGRPQRLTQALSVHNNMTRLCSSLLEAAAMNTQLTTLRGASTPSTASSPWCKLRHLDSPACEKRLQDICGALGGAECSELVLDRLVEQFRQERSCELPYVMNQMAAGPNSPDSFLQRILDTYIEEDVWYLPLEVGSGEAPVTQDETLDVSIYNPRAWSKDSVPGLYEGAVETRYTDIGYSAPRPAARRDPDKCSSLAEAQRNMTLCSLMTEGVGIIAKRLGDKFQPYLLKTLCLVLERVGSKYELVHLSGLGALEALAEAGGHESVGALVAANADYFTHQVTLRLKKSWNSESALQILSVVMEYSDASILDCLYGIVNDVLVQSCDKYYEKNLYAYLQVFLTFVDRIRKWFPLEDTQKPAGNDTDAQIDLFKDLLDFIKNNEEAEKLMSNEEFEKETGKSVEEMYKDYQQKKEDDILDYDDRVTEEKQPLPQHISVMITILKRCSNFIASRQRDETILALQVLDSGLPALKHYEDELLPLVHVIWGPLVVRFETQEPVVLRRALALLVTMAKLSKDFILSRCVKEVLPQIYQWLHRSSADSYLKDAGSWYRSSAAYELQVAALSALPKLATHLRLTEDRLESAMKCVDAYLSNKQPKPLQALAVDFFKAILDYDYGAAWYHLRALCGNEQVLEPPALPAAALEPVTGSPFEAANKDLDANVKLIFNLAVT
ncbi:hypothetical protein ABMA27_001681 [Loxostege sticticalis]|uniref:TELO2-interacting protein 1 homolog n=1 Tax=Loxostege sticticalis TaxID=481309 RepID=A0ABR3HZC7_LOXSC